MFFGSVLNISRSNFCCLLKRCILSLLANMCCPAYFGFAFSNALSSSVSNILSKLSLTSIDAIVKIAWNCNSLGSLLISVQSLIAASSVKFFPGPPASSCILTRALRLTFPLGNCLFNAAISLPTFVRDSMSSDSVSRFRSIPI